MVSRSGGNHFQRAQSPQVQSDANFDLTTTIKMRKIYVLPTTFRYEKQALLDNKFAKSQLIADRTCKKACPQIMCTLQTNWTSNSSKSAARPKKHTHTHEHIHTHTHTHTHSHTLSHTPTNPHTPTHTPTPYTLSALETLPNSMKQSK